MRGKKSDLTIFGIGPNATIDELRASYRKKILEAHPDKGGCAAEFHVVQCAYDRLKVLMDPVQPHAQWRRSSVLTSKASYKLVRPQTSQKVVPRESPVMAPKVVPPQASPKVVPQESPVIVPKVPAARIPRKVIILDSPVFGPKVAPVEASLKVILLESPVFGPKVAPPETLPPALTHGSPVFASPKIASPQTLPITPLASPMIVSLVSPILAPQAMPVISPKAPLVLAPQTEPEVAQEPPTKRRRADPHSPWQPRSKCRTLSSDSESHVTKKAPNSHQEEETSGHRPATRIAYQMKLKVPNKSTKSKYTKCETPSANGSSSSSSCPPPPVSIGSAHSVASHTDPTSTNTKKCEKRTAIGSSTPFSVHPSSTSTSNKAVCSRERGGSASPLSKHHKPPCDVVDVDVDAESSTAAPVQQRRTVAEFIRFLHSQGQKQDARSEHSFQEGVSSRRFQEGDSASSNYLPRSSEDSGRASHPKTQKKTLAEDTQDTQSYTSGNVAVEEDDFGYPGLSPILRRYHSGEQCCNVRGCHTGAKGKTVRVADDFGPPGRRCNSHGGGYTCKVEGCSNCVDGRGVVNDDEYGAPGRCCLKHNDVVWRDVNGSARIWMTAEEEFGADGDAGFMAV
eukprot:GEMP01004040.1.p1 GENE.GEMP01004040.1~~GEMP01004040.1.p1  ORF type:complete len:624 (+),score=98.26 GEMP01004040.1:101-1972(+)